MPKIKGWKDPNYIKANIFFQIALNDLTVPKVATKIGLSKNAFYQQLASPTQFRLGTLQKLTKLFGCKMEDLLNQSLGNGL